VKLNHIRIGAVILLLGGMYLWLAWRWRYLQNADGVIYMDTARNWLEGKGWVHLDNGRLVPTVFWPPLFPALLAAASLLTGGDPLKAALLVQGAGLAATYYLIYRFLKEERIRPLVIFLTLWIFTGSWVFFLYFGTLSESVFLPLTAASFYFYRKWQKTGSRRLLLLTGLLAGLLMLTRYAGAGLTAAYAYLILRRSGKVRDVLSFLLPAIILFLPWYAYTSRHSVFFSRPAAWHPPGFDHLRQLVITGVNALAPGATEVLFPLLLLAIVAYIFFGRRKGIDLPLWAADATVGAGMYVLFILLSISIFDYDTPLDIRILSPAYLMILLAAAAVFDRLYRLRSRYFYLLASLLFLTHGIDMYQKSTEIENQVRELYRLRNSPLTAEIPPQNDLIIWTNVTEFVRLRTENDTLVMDLPAKYDRKSLVPDTSYSRRMDELARQIRQGRAMLIYFYGFHHRKFIAGPEELDSLFGDLPVRTYPEGFVILPPQNSRHE